MTSPIAQRLRARARRRGAEPLVTYYDLSSGERTELSAVSFLNWVDKTSNLLVDDYAPDPGAEVDLQLARTAPGHWMTLVLELAVWQIGGLVRVQSAAAPGALLVLGPDWEQHDRSTADQVLACSLHPLGLGFPAPLPSPMADLTEEVRSQPDQHAPPPVEPGRPAWRDDTRTLTQAELVELDPGVSPGRRLVRVSDPWSSVRDGLLVPILTDGSAVLVVGDDPDRLARIVATERVDIEPGR